jgi:hypothetical protein
MRRVRWLRASSATHSVMRGLVPRIPLIETRCSLKRDGRDKPGQDELRDSAMQFAKAAATGCPAFAGHDIGERWSRYFRATLDAPSRILRCALSRGYGLPRPRRCYRSSATPSRATIVLGRAALASRASASMKASSWLGSWWNKQNVLAPASFASLTPSCQVECPQPRR